MDLTIEVMLPVRGDTDFSRERHGSYQVLAPVAVYSRKNPSSVNLQRTGFLHVTDVPVVDKGSEERTLIHLNSVLCAQWQNPDRTLRDRRVWCGVPAALPMRVVNALLTNRQATVTWAEFKTLFRHQVDIRNLTDGDIA